MSNNDIEVSVAPGVGMMTKEPFVSITFGETKAQLSVTDAREIGMFLLECAEAAVSDCAVVTYFTDTVNLPLEQAGVILRELRAHRSDMRGQE